MIAKLTTKTILSFVALFIAILVIGMVAAENRATADGYIYLVIEDADGSILFDDTLPFYEGDAFYDVLERAFTLTCANATYQPDETCAHAFTLGPQMNGTAAQTDKVILGIKGSNFNIMTNWTDNFLAFEVLIDANYVLTSQGPSNLFFENEQSFRIKVKGAQSAWGNGS